MKILFVWTGLTSYMGDCWRALAAQPGVELKVIIVQQAHAVNQIAFQTADVLRELDARIVDDDRPTDAVLVQELEKWCPDVMFIVGWRAKVCRWLVENPQWRDTRKVCCFDMPWRWKLRCLLAPLVLGRFLRQYDAAYVPGAVCARYAKWLGFKKIYKGLFSIDTERFAVVEPDGKSSQARRDFVYIGRNSPEKRLDDLRAAYSLYRERGGAFGLKLFGKGLEGGFISPAEVPEVMQKAAAVVLASDFDPWPLVFLEAMSAGCPVIASDRCTNRPELGKNWHVFKCGDVEGLSRTMMDVERVGDSEIMRQENFNLVKMYDCKAWTERVMGICKELVVGR